MIGPIYKERVKHERIRDAMPKKQKIDLAKVLATLGTLCEKCGYSIPPNERRLVDFDNVQCPQCGARFVPGTGAWNQ
jgi:uncharacterized OB-fold protein